MPERQFYPGPYVRFYVIPTHLRSSTALMAAMVDGILSTAKNWHGYLRWVLQQTLEATRFKTAFGSLTCRKSALYTYALTCRRHNE